MLGLTKPRYFIPIHGEFRMQVQHGRLAMETGVLPENVFIIENGTPIEIFADGSARRGQPVPAGYVFVDGLSVGEVGEVVLRDRRALANDGMFLVVVTVDKQTGNVVGRPEIVTRGFVHGNEERSDHRGGRRPGHRRDREPGRPHQRGRAAQGADQGRGLAASCTSRRSAARWSSRSWWRSRRMATRRKASTRRAVHAPRTRSGCGMPRVRRSPPEVARSLVGIAMLVLGAVTLIALALPRPGEAHRLVARDAVVPFFGTGRWLLPFVLLIAGAYVEWGPGRTRGALAVARSSAACSPTSACSGILEFVPDPAPAGSGGRIGAFLADTLGDRPR